MALRLNYKVSGEDCISFNETRPPRLRRCVDISRRVVGIRLVRQVVTSRVLELLD